MHEWRKERKDQKGIEWLLKDHTNTPKTHSENGVLSYLFYRS